MSGLIATANPRRIKAAHRRRRRTAAGQSVQRYYDPTIGRFLSVDPVTADGNTGGNFNRYWYANNNPYRFTDPDGRMAMDEFRRIMDSGDRPRPQIGRGCNDGHTCYGGGGSDKPKESKAGAYVGLVGNTIKSFVDSDVEKEMFDQYWEGR